MTFLSMTQTMGWLLAGTTATAIIVIFFLRVQHRRAFVSSSILWERVLERRRRRSLIELLRRLISLLIALLIGLSLALALGEVELGRAGREPRDVRLVVDNRPTMAALMSDGRPRLAHALEKAGEVLAGGSAADRFTVYDAEGRVVAAAARDRDAVREALADLRPTARRLSMPLVDQESEVWLLTDGVSVGEVDDDIRVIAAYEPVLNAGVTAFEIRPQPTDPYAYEAFLEVGNFSTSPQSVRIVLRDRAGIQFRRDIELAAAGVYRNTFDLSPLEGGLLRAEVELEGDGFGLDDQAHVWLPRTAPVRLAYVTETARMLPLLGTVPHLELTRMTPADYAMQAGDDAVDAYLFEDWAPSEPPSAAAVLFAPPAVAWLPAQLGVAEEPGTFPFDAAAPLLRNVDLHDVLIERATIIDGSGARVLAGDDELPLIVTSDTPTRWLLFSFALEDSDLEQAVGFPILAANLVQWLRADAPAERADLGTVATSLGNARVREVSTGEAIETRSAGGRSFFVADAPGMYVASDGTRMVRYAVRLDGRERSMVNASRFEADEAAIEATPAARSLWPTLLGVAAVFLLLEGLTYHRRVTV